jgi:hypothetical protein
MFIQNPREKYPKWIDTRSDTSSRRFGPIRDELPCHGNLSLTDLVCQVCLCPYEYSQSEASRFGKLLRVLAKLFIYNSMRNLSDGRVGRELSTGWNLTLKRTWNVQIYGRLRTRLASEPSLQCIEAWRHPFSIRPHSKNGNVGILCLMRSR